MKKLLKLHIKKTKIVVSGPITSWQIDGEKIETVTDCIFLGSKITVDGDCSHGIKRHLLLGRKAMTSLDSILKKQRQCFLLLGNGREGNGNPLQYSGLENSMYREGWWATVLGVAKNQT